MKKEDIEFLKELQHELRTQPTDSQAEPKFWAIATKIRIPDENGDVVTVYDPEETESYTLEGYIDYINYVLSIESSYKEEDRERWSQINKKDAEKIKDFVNDVFHTPIEIFYENEKYVVAEDTFFLTKREAKKHIELNGYHYNEPHPYAQTAWRSPEFERFMKIFTEMNLDDIKYEED